MRRTLVIAVAALAMLAGSALAQGFGEPRVPDNTYLQPERRDAYGLGVHSDATGRPFQYETGDGQKVIIERVKPDAYGPGVSMDPYGRPASTMIVAGSERPLSQTDGADSPGREQMRL